MLVTVVFMLYMQKLFQFNWGNEMETKPESFYHPCHDPIARYEPNIEVFNPDPGFRSTEGTEFEGWDLAKVEAFMKENMFIASRQLPDGTWCGLYPLAFTLSVCMDITEHSPYGYRWCFEDSEEAKLFFSNAKTFDEVPEKRESLKGHRYGRAARLLSTDQLGLRKW